MGWLGDLLGSAATIGGGLIGGPAGAAIGAGVGGAISGAGKGAQADKLNKQRLQMSTDRYNAGAPFRSKLAETAFAIPTQREDLSSLFADPGNPYARVAPRPPVIQGPQSIGSLPAIQPQHPGAIQRVLRGASGGF